MAERTCHNCVYSVCDPGLWLRHAWRGEPLVPRCANHPDSPGRLVDVTGVPCRNFQPKPPLPCGDGIRMVSLGEGYYAYVDAADYEWLSRWNWSFIGGYAVRFEKRKVIFMHRQIMQPPEGMVVDHVDHNKLNNCRLNLRVCTHGQNMGNRGKHGSLSSRFKGVSYSTRTQRWRAHCRCRGKPRLSKLFDSEVEAARAYDRAAVEWFREYAKLNFPAEWPPERRAEVYAQHKAEEETKVGKEEGKKQRSKKTSSRAEPRSRRARKRTTKPPRATGHKPRSTDAKPQVTSHEPPVTAPKTAKRTIKKEAARAETQGRRDNHQSQIIDNQSKGPPATTPKPRATKKPKESDSKSHGTNNKKAKAPSGSKRKAKRGAGSAEAPP